MQDISTVITAEKPDKKFVINPFSIAPIERWRELLGIFVLVFRNVMADPDLPVFIISLEFATPNTSVAHGC